MTNVTSTMPTSLSTSSTDGTVVVETVVLCIIIAVSLLGNLSLWIVVLRSRSLRTITNMFLLGLSAADLFVATFNMPVTVYVIIKGYWDLSETACVITGYTNMLTLCTSVLSLCNISINRYIMVVKPGKFREIYTVRKAVTMITAVVLLAAFLSALPLLGWCEYKFIPTHSFCFADWANHMSYAFFMIGCCFCIPFFVMTICNIFIFRAVRSSRKKVKSVISPASFRDKARDSVNPSEISNIQDPPEVNCSSTDVNRTFDMDGGLDKIKIKSPDYKVPSQIQVDSNDSAVIPEDTIDKYKVSEHNSEAGTDTNSNDKDRNVDNYKNNTTIPPIISLELPSTDTNDADEPEQHGDDDCQSTTSSCTTSSCTETSCLRAYNPAFDRHERSRGRPVTRGNKQQYLTIPRGEIKYVPENKQLQRTGLSFSDSSLHSSSSEGSLKLTPIQIQLQDDNIIQQTENNNVVISKGDIVDDKHDINTDNKLNKTRLTGILTNNNTAQRTPELHRKSVNGQHRNVSLNMDKNRSIDHRSELSDSDKTNRRSTFLSRKHSSPPPRRREEIVLARSLAVVVVLFVLCWLPYCISMLLSIFYQGNVPRGFHMFTLLIGYANSGCNPIVYGAMNKRFAVGYKNLFCFWRDHRLSFNNSSSI